MSYVVAESDDDGHILADSENSLDRPKRSSLLSHEHLKADKHVSFSPNSPANKKKKPLATFEIMEEEEKFEINNSKTSEIRKQDRFLNAIKTEVNENKGRAVEIKSEHGQKCDGCVSGVTGCCHRIRAVNAYVRSKPILFGLVVFVFLLAVARGVGKSSNSSLSSQIGQDDEESEFKNAADEAFAGLLDKIGGPKRGPMIISTTGSNAEGMHAVRAVLSSLGVATPDTTAPMMKWVLPNGQNIKSGYKRVLEHALHPEKGFRFDERSVADLFSLSEWHLGRAFVISCLNRTVSRIPKQAQKSIPWAYVHPRAGYLLPFFLSLFGTENFKFIQVVSNGMHVAGKTDEEFRHMCPLLRSDKLCVNTLQNKLTFWAQTNSDAFKWAREKLDVDRYVAIRAEDFSAGRIECIERIAKALGLKYSHEDLEHAAAAGKLAREHVVGEEDSSSEEISQAAIAIPIVREQLRFWGYDSITSKNDKSCKSMGWI